MRKAGDSTVVNTHPWMSKFQLGRVPKKGRKEASKASKKENMVGEDCTIDTRRRSFVFPFLRTE